MENALLADKKSLHFYVTLVYKVAQSGSGEMNKFKQEISILITMLLLSLRDE